MSERQSADVVAYPIITKPISPHYKEPRVSENPERQGCNEKYDVYALYLAPFRLINIFKPIESYIWEEKDSETKGVCVPYKIELNDSKKIENVHIALQSFNEKMRRYNLPIRFQVYSELKGFRKRNHMQPINNFIRFIEDLTDPDNTSAPVGKDPSDNIVRIGSAHCVFDILHEMMHVLGFEHEHQRFDREEDLPDRLVENGIKTKKERDFDNGNILKLKGIPVTPYDKNSIMHYPCKLINGRRYQISGYPTSKPTELTEYDILGIKMLCGFKFCTREEIGRIDKNKTEYPQSHYICKTCVDKVFCLWCGKMHISNVAFQKHELIEKFLINFDQKPVTEQEMNVELQIKRDHLKEYCVECQCTWCGRDEDQIALHPIQPDKEAFTITEDTDEKD